MPEDVAIIHAAMAEISTRQQNADIQTDGRLIVDTITTVILLCALIRKVMPRNSKRKAS